MRLELLPVALAVMGAVSLMLWRMRSRYDVLALGRDIAVNLGVDYRRTLLATLAAIAALVSVSTALVGPVTFFGLLVSNLAYQLMGSDRHRHALPAAMLLAVVFLVGGQTLLERVLQLNTTVSVVIEFLGGIVFLTLILRRGAGDRYPERQQALRRQRGGRRRDAGAAGRRRHRHHRPEWGRQVHAAVHDQPPAAAVRGRVLVEGLDVARADSRELARRLAILRQDNHLPLRLTVRDLVAFGRYPHSGGRLTLQDKEHVDRAIDYLELEPLADRYLDEMSGGQRQRAFVAMVLCQDTRYVLLDEPLNSLDMKHAVAMMGTLRRAADELGKTVVLVLHDINFASCYADRIVALKQGRVACQGAPAELVRAEVLSALYALPIAVHEIDGRRICVYYR